MDSRHNHARRAVPVISAGLAVVLSLAACGSAADRATNASSTAPRIASAPVSTDDVYGGVATEQTPVYWAGSDEQSGYLFREFRTASTADTADPVAEAVIMMTSQEPLDPDYRSLWSAVKSVGTSVSPDGTITVDLPATAFASQFSADEAELALQQLVYTVSAAAVTAGLLDADTAKEVRVLVDGQSDYKAFGSVDLKDPISRDASKAAPVWLIDPQTGTESGSPLTMFGRVLPEFTSAQWEVIPVDGDTAVKSGEIAGPQETPASAAATEFRVPVEVPAGDYTVRVTGSNEDGEQIIDDHTVTVVAD
ncbi:GerMN domain-containing protein [Kocuria sp. cx-455]|uniref:GerMN domain-containing protein n=1 Tax=Kocuria sp. cx-455 TaxID=2771377 RepID=UPI0016828864|nr:GerMN domain-containing protein [Kocuria sp. cx-455]MBD2765413.1 GerMN domain-containing protein [Kocuria sp. cx-455]